MATTPIRRSLAAIYTWKSAEPAQALSIATVILCLLGVIAAGAAVTSFPLLTILSAAVICGWAELDGACGASHVGALTPLRALDQTHRLWRRSVIAYTVGGVATGSIVGSLLGAIGLTVRPLLHSTPVLGLVILILIALCARELRLFRYALPQVHLQTQRLWAVQFGHVTGAAMWGAHIGLGFATVIKHGGIYIVAALALMQGPLEGAALMAAFWIGRTLPMWIMPILVSREVARDGATLIDLVARSDKALRGAALVGFLMFAVRLLVG